MEKIKSQIEQFNLYLQLNYTQKGFTVCGTSDLPSAPLAHPWDAGEARKRLLEWSDGDWSKYAKAFVIKDPEKAETEAGYKLPFADVVNGKLMIIPRALMAAAGALGGSRSAMSIESAMRAAQQFVGALYERILQRKAPWDQ